MGLKNLYKSLANRRSKPSPSSLTHLDDLEIKDLVKMLKNIKLGRDYLRTFLSQQQFDELLRIGTLQNSQKINVQSDTQEKVGNVALVLNTILTSSLGAWLGFAGFSGLHLNSFFTIMIISLGIMIGASIGRLSYNLTHRQAAASIVDLKLFNIQNEIINLIIQRRIVVLEKNIYKVLKKINFIASEKLVGAETSLAYLERFLTKAISDERFQEDIAAMLDSLEDTPHKEFYQRMSYILITKIKKITKQLLTHQKATTKTLVHFDNDNFSESDLLMNTSLTNASYVRILTKADLRAKRLVPKAHHWLRNNFMGVLVGLLPTLMGGFASMFVFLDGIPDILKAFHLFSSYFLTYAFTIKVLSISFAICVTSYLGYSNLHTNFKAFRRTKQLEHAEIKVAEVEEQMMNQVILLNIILRLNSLLTQLKLLYQSLKILNKSTAPTEECELI